MNDSEDSRLVDSAPANKEVGDERVGENEDDGQQEENSNNGNDETEVSSENGGALHQAQVTATMEDWQIKDTESVDVDGTVGVTI